MLQGENKALDMVCPEEQESWPERQERLKPTQVFLLKHVAGGRQRSQTRQTVITVLQVFVTLITARIPRGVSGEAMQT